MRLARLAGAKLVPFLYDSSDDLEVQLAERGLHLVQLRMPSNEHYLHFHDGHYNEVGHELVGRRLFQAIVTIMDEEDSRFSVGSGSIP